MSDSQGPDVPGQETPGQNDKAVPTPGQNDKAVPTPAAAPVPGPAARPVFADRSYRSKSGVAAGVLLNALALWMCIDALVKGHGRTPWIALATLLLVIPLVSAFTLWPLVRANDDRLVVRNPFRTVTAPWKQVESLQAALSVELRAGGRKFQVWAVPVSLRQRKRAGRKSMIAKADASVMGSRRGTDSRFPAGGPGLRSALSRTTANTGYGADPAAAGVAWADRVVDELRDLRARAVEEDRPAADGPVAVSWTWWVSAPAVVGAVALIVLLVTG
ncbi:PH domain-containing protein [Streptacidiphilus carbonis]|uniref:PH domain-containing protein n=1 Tax=Streptacidiphilus carbonis TaxID=105422 RepID=UPI000A0682AC|nr:PH domain-containing protein [Streptacidiphilus carbonis]